MSQTLTCPKCQSDMRSYERNRVLVDQCTNCGGIFLDKGELEALAAAENAWHGQQAVPQPSTPPQQPAQHGYAQQYPPAQRYATSKQRHGYGQPYGRKKGHSFLGDLFG